MAALVTVAACGKDTPTTPTPTPGAAIAVTGSLAFGNVVMGGTATASMTIANSGTAALTVTSISYPAGFSGNFASGSIAAAGSQVVTVTFAPTTAAAHTGTITINGNHASGSNTIAVSGTGVASATFTLSGVVTESAPTTSTVLAGAVITFIDGANQGRTATSGADGRYSITGVSNGGYTVSATLAGYVGAAVPVGVDGNTTLNIRLDPIAARTRFGPGQYRVNSDIPAGLYYSDPGHGCRFQRLRGFGGTSADVITVTQVNFDAGQWIVQLLGTDAGFETDAACSFWFTTPRRGLEASITAGSWLVGTQVTAGTYRAANAAVGCEWQRLSSFTGSADAVIASAFSSSAGAQLVTIAGTDVGFSSTAECGTWTRTATAATER
jgi:hypothetical protein